MMMSESAIALFARPPVEGQVKTRLAATVGAAAALEIYRQLLDRTLLQAAASGFTVVLFASSESVELSRLAASHGTTLSSQQGNGLGERMVRALAQMHERFARVLLIGSDCPVITAAHLHQAMQRLNDTGLVMGPAEDGGFWLLGSALPWLWQQPALLDGVEFGGVRARAMTLAELQRRGVEVNMLPLLWDLDTEPDYRRAKSMGLLR
jgi:uncharacterized protein